MSQQYHGYRLAISASFALSSVYPAADAISDQRCIASDRYDPIDPFSTSLLSLLNSTYDIGLVGVVGVVLFFHDGLISCVMAL